MRNHRLRGLLVVIVLLCGCSGEKDRDTAPAATDVPAPATGVYAGTFPCDGCPGIEATLWLRADGRFVLRQRYLAYAGGEAETYYALGRWRWRAEDARLVLSGPGPDRLFTRSQDDGLELITTTGLAHRLSILAEAAPFSDSLQLEGEFSLRDGVPVFTECETDLSWRVSTRGDYRRLRHQYGTLPRGATAFATVDGRLALTEDDGVGHEILLIEKLVRLEQDRSCR